MTHENETLRWPTNLDRAGIEKRLVEVREIAQREGLEELAKRFEGWSMHVRLDEETLRSIADLTRGEYFYAGNAVELKRIYESMRSRMVLETKKTEITAIFAAVAAALVVLAAGLSLAWFNRII